MPKTKETPRFEDFAYQGPNSDIDVDAVLSRREKLWVPTDYFDGKHVQQLLVTGTLPEPENHTKKAAIACGTAWTDEASRPDNGLFDYYIAQATGRPVYSVHAPGVHYSRWRTEEFDNAYGLTPDQKDQLREDGSFEKVGSATMRAIEWAHMILDSSNKEGLIVSASSQGAAMVAGGLPDAVDRNETPIRAVVLSEIVNNTEQPFLRGHIRPPFAEGLGPKFLQASAHKDNYLAQNPQALQDAGEGDMRWLQRTVNNIGANITYARALARGAFNGDLDDATLERMARGEAGTEFTLTRGGESLLAAEEAHEATRRRLGEKGLRVVNNITYPGHTHPYTMTVRSITDPVNQLKDVA